MYEISGDLIQTTNGGNKEEGGRDKWLDAPSDPLLYGR